MSRVVPFNRALHQTKGSAGPGVPDLGLAQLRPTWPGFHRSMYQAVYWYASLEVSSLRRNPNKTPRRRAL